MLLCDLSPLIAVVPVNLSFESFVLDHTTSALLLETIFFLSKKHAIYAYILSIWLTLIVACHYTNIILCRPLFSDSSLMTTGPVLTTGHLPGERTSLYTLASFTPSLDTFVLDISLIEVSKI